MKSDGGVKTKLKKHTRTSRQQTEKSAVCYEARATRDITDGVQEAALVSMFSKLFVFVCVILPRCPQILSYK